MRELIKMSKDQFGTKRSGIYGKGFTHMPFSEQKQRVDKAFTFEPPGRVVQQMDFIVAIEHGSPESEKIKNYAVQKAHALEASGKGRSYDEPIKQCPPGMVHVKPYTNVKGQSVTAYCRRKSAYASPELREHITGRRRP